MWLWTGGVVGRIRPHPNNSYPLTKSNNTDDDGNQADHHRHHSRRKNDPGRTETENRDRRCANSLLQISRKFSISKRSENFVRVIGRVGDAMCIFSIFFELFSTDFPGKSRRFRPSLWHSDTFVGHWCFSRV